MFLMCDFFPFLVIPQKRVFVRYFFKKKYYRIKLHFLLELILIQIIFTTLVTILFKFKLMMI